ncbi:MAG: phage antirepressor KilAC domain-containing protein [Aeromonadaceae bacterium]
MNNLIEMSGEMTMGTKDIAELLGKNHSDIKRSAERLQSAGALTQPLAELIFEHKGNQYTQYMLNKLDSITLVAQNSPKFTAALVKRWDELERESAKPSLPDFSDPVAAARAWADSEEQKRIAQQQLAIAAPKAQFVDRYVEASGTYTFRQVAKMLGIKENTFREFLLCGDNPVMYRLAGRLTPYSNHVEAGRFIQRTGVADNDHSYTESRFTTKGVEWIAGELAKAEAKNKLGVAL